MRKWIKRISVGAAILLLAAALVGAWVAYRASRTPQWYTDAIDCPVEDAHVAEQIQLIPFANWLARSAAGNPDQLPARDREYEVTLTVDQLNALLAKWTDNLHGEVQTLRVKLGDDEMTLQGTWEARGRTVGLRLKASSAGDGRPAAWISSVRVGEQGVPLSWVNAMPIAKLNEALADFAKRDKPIGIDEHGSATPRLARICTTAALLSLAQGYAVEPIVFASPRLSIDDTVPLNLIGARCDSKTLTLTFQLLSPPEQKALIDHANAVAAAHTK